MRRLIARASAVVAAGAVAGALGVSAAGAAAQAPHPARTSSLAAARQMAVPGAKLWVQRYNGPGNGSDAASSVAVSSGGGTVFVTGASTGATSFSDYLTVAYNAATGARLWTARYNGPGNGGDGAASVAVSPDGATVFVTGASGGAAAVSVARDGTKVFVTGTSFWNGDAASGMATVAYRASDGAQLWVARLNGPAGNTGARAIVSPGGNRGFVTGEVQGDYGTLAYSARTGARLWARFYGGRRSFEFANSVAVSPGGTVLVTGGSRGPAGLNTDYATVAYSPGGHHLWVRRYSGPGNHSDIAYAVAVPSSARVYVTGTSWGGIVTGDDYATIAYNVRTGATVWVRRYNGPASGGDSATALAARGGRVFVTGGSTGTTSGDDYATIAYNG